MRRSTPKSATPATPSATAPPPTPVGAAGAHARALRALLDAAARRRTLPIPPATDVLRLADGDAGDDACGPFVLDRYGAVLRLEVSAPAWPLDVDAIARGLADELAAAAVVGVLRVAGGTSELRALVGAAPALHVAHEAGARYAVRTHDDDPQAHAVGTGIFVDHREGRRLVRARSRGATVLNLFAHAGAFGVAAAVGGARRVDHVDAAKKCAPWAALNLALNGFDPRAHRFIVDDAIDVLAKAARKRAGYDLIILDPPTTALRPSGKRFHVEKDLPLLIVDALAALAPNGSLLVSTNDRALTTRDLRAMVREHGLHDVEDIAAPPDVPSAPMRGVIVEVGPRA